MKELNDIQTVCDCLGTWWGQIHTRAAQGLLDIHRVSEDVATTLLNLVFNLVLKNLNREKKNFPGIDLGDDTNEIAFQVTARKGPAKIKKDINTFIETHQGRFPRGIRFLILSNEKPRISEPECREYREKCPGFDPDGDILNFHDLIDEIKKIYHEDNPRFVRIRNFLEEEFGPVQSKTEDPLKILLGGSTRYYRNLRGPNGRYRNLRIADILLPQTQAPDQDLETTVETEPGAPGQTAARALAGMWPQPVKHAVIVGEGGMGKTVSLLHWWEQLLEQAPKNGPIPVFIALNELNQVPQEKRRVIRF